MTPASPLWAFFDAPAAFLMAVRIVVALIGVFIGWIIAAPLVRIFFRLAFQRPAPGWLQSGSKLAGSLLLGFLIFMFLPLGGGGGGGLGTGGGTGDGTGKGSGKDSGNGSVVKNGDKGQPDKKNSIPSPKTRQPLEIEIIDVDRYKGDEHYYLLQRKEPAKTLAEVEEHIKDKKDKLEVHILMTTNSVSRREAQDPLEDLTKRYEIPSVAKMVDGPKKKS
jgi:hypothetical protein